MNKILLTHDRVFMSIVGPSGCGKTELLFRMLKGSTFYPRFEKIYYFYRVPTTFQRYATSYTRD